MRIQSSRKQKRLAINWSSRSWRVRIRFRRAVRRLAQIPLWVARRAAVNAFRVGVQRSRRGAKPRMPAFARHDATGGGAVWCPPGQLAPISRSMAARLLLQFWHSGRLRPAPICRAAVNRSEPRALFRMSSLPRL
jgi:hypothetical protein